MSLLKPLENVTASSRSDLKCLKKKKVCFTVSKLGNLGDILKKIDTVPNEEIAKELRELKGEIKLEEPTELEETVEE